MKSIKPGRGPSKQSFVGGIFMVIFGVFWTILAFGVVGSGAGLFGIIFPLFGVCWTGLAAYNTYIAYKNAHGEDRMSLYDITEDNEEPDPWSPDYEQRKTQQKQGKLETNCETQDAAKFCPYCGKEVEPEHKFCKYCGKPLE
ncbi:MAG: zinc-ribbon domain-containing protein [Oscillospiraceae bacterium]|nr:zinc-ribbon domain-containing protein [Oscillospiraceae bacterium]